jgi:hypothetical protein
VPPQHSLPDLKIYNMVEKSHYCFLVEELLWQNPAEVQNHIYVKSTTIFNNRTR